MVCVVIGYHVVCVFTYRSNVVKNDSVYKANVMRVDLLFRIMKKNCNDVNY